MGVGASTKQKSNTNESFDPTSLAMFNSAFNPAMDALSGFDTTAYGGPLGAGLDAQQTQAAGMAQANVGAGQGALGQAIQGATAAGGYQAQNVNAGQLAGMDYSQYMNPYLESVLGSTMGAIDRQRQMALVGNSQAAGAGAWGGSRHGVADSLTNEAALREASSAANNIYAQGFGQAQQAGQFDINAMMQGQLANQSAGLQNAGLGLQASNALAGFGQQQQNMGLTDANAINAFGQQAQATQQNANQMALDEFIRQQQLPLLQSGAYGQLAGQVPVVTDSKGKTVQSSSPGLLGYFSANANLAANALSDVRRKKNIEHALVDGRGRNWYDFHYDYEDDGEAKHRGVMAQEVLLTDPQAVSVRDDGWLQVNYGALN